jgi:poly(3-hydroxybutyrate) depolymerase
MFPGFNPSFERCYTLSLVNDVHFTNAILDWAQSHLCHDPNRVYAIGTSNGAAMVINLTCSLPHRFTAFAYTGGVMRETHFPLGSRCHGDPALVRPVLAAVGGGDVYRKRLLTNFTSTFGTQSKCHPKVRTLEPTANTQCVRYEHCDPGGHGRVELCTIGHLDHCWGGTRCCDPKVC